MQEKSQVQALDSTCGVWLPAKITQVEAGYFQIKWTGYNLTARLAENMVRKPVLKRICKLPKVHWPTLDPRSLQRGDKVVHIQPGGEDGSLLQIEENDPWNGKIKVADRFYLYEHLRESKDDEVDHHTTQEPDKDGDPVKCQEKRRVSKTTKVTTQRTKDNTSAKQPFQQVTSQAKVTPANVKAKAAAQQSKKSTRSKQPLQEATPHAKQTSVDTALKVQRQPLKELHIQSKTATQTSADKQKRKRQEPVAKQGATKKRQVTKEAATTLVVGEPWKATTPPLTQQEKEKVEGVPLKDIENCPPSLLIKYGMAALNQIDSPDEELIELDEMPPPMSPLSPHDTTVTTPTAWTTDLRTTVELLQLSLEEEQRKRRIVEDKLSSIEHKLEQLIQGGSRQNADCMPATPAHATPHHQPQPPATSQQQPPQTPLMAIPPASTEETIHKIFATKLDSPQYAPDGTITCYSLKADILRELTWYSQSPQAMARELMKKLFTPYELATSNVRGVRKAALDPVRVETIHTTVFQLCSVPPYMQTLVWKDCVKSMDQANRNAKKLKYASFS